MCQDCGCSNVGTVGINGEVVKPDYHADHDHTHDHTYHHDHDHTHHHTHPHLYDSPESTPAATNSSNAGDLAPHSHTVPVYTSLLAKNDRIAERNRGYFQANDLLVLNVLSSPGSGKTALIERMIRDLSDWLVASQQRSLQVGVIVGDLETDNDAQRLRHAGAPAIQITTGQACHLEAEMISQAMLQLDLDHLDLLVIENVGNLVCPAAYDLGETLRVVLLSVTEGEDKPLKYPTVFKTANVVLITKIDIGEVVGFDRNLAISNIRQMAPQSTVFEVSARTGQGMENWYAYLEGFLTQRGRFNGCTCCHSNP